MKFLLFTYFVFSSSWKHFFFFFPNCSINCILIQAEHRKTWDFLRPLHVDLHVCSCWKTHQILCTLKLYTNVSRGLIYGWCVKPYSSFPLSVLCVGKPPPLSMVFAENVCLVKGEVGLQIFFCARHKGKGVASSQQQNERRLSALFKGLPLPLLSLLWIL